MFIQVRLIKGFPEPLLYEVPEDWDTRNLIGAIVHVPIQTRIAPAVVLRTLAHKPDCSFTIKPAHARDPFPDDKQYHTFLSKLSAYYQVNRVHFIKRIRQFLTATALKPINNPPAYAQHKAQEITLTDEQQKVVNFLAPHITTPSYTPTVLHGVTGSGKTEVYKKLIMHALNQGKHALLMLPEVTLAIQFEQKLRAQLSSEITICGFHSAISAKNKKILWQRLLNNESTLIIGVHLPILLPLPNLGIVIVDEEHEVGYQEKKHPKINSKEAALMRAQLHGVPILLGSATPSVSSLYNVKKRGWHFFQMHKRFAGAMPKIQTVFLTDKKQRRNFWISQQLQDAIKDRLQKREQIIIFLNRRGYSFFVQCKECSFVFECTNCSVSLTLHGTNQLNCHYCGHNKPLPPACPSCKADEKKLLKKGIGTQQIVTVLEKLFPSACVGRADMDTTTKKKVWQETMDQFESGAMDILVGTQTITKGFHFPRVTLVGIIWADLNLHFPMYNAAETTLQQLIQVAGRAGRSTQDSLVIVQAMIDHPVFAHLNEVGYLEFYEKEVETREMVGYPPCARLAEIELKHTDEGSLERDSNKLVDALHALNKEHDNPLTILGPAKPPVAKIKRVHVRKIYIKSDTFAPIHRLFQKIDAKYITSHIFFTPNPGT